MAEIPLSWNEHEKLQKIKQKERQLNIALEQRFNQKAERLFNALADRTGLSREDLDAELTKRERT